LTHPYHDVAIAAVHNTKQAKRLEGHDSFSITVEAALGVVDAAGIDPLRIDGIVGQFSADLAYTLRLGAAWLPSGGFGSIPGVLEAANAIAAGYCRAVLVVGGGAAMYADRSSTAPWTRIGGEFVMPFGIYTALEFALIARRHMHLYGTKREHFAEVAISTRENAIKRETSIMKTPLTIDDYFAARLISEPLCLYDFCLECDGAVAVITTSLERARDLKHPPVRVTASAHGGMGRWGQAITWMNMPDDYFVSSGHRPVAQRLWAMAGLGPQDVDVALLYDHFSPMVLMQLEDYGFCGIGEAGPFVEAGNIRWPNGSLPVNTHGGNLSEAYIIGMTHVREGVEQIRGTAVNQVANAEVALVTGGPASIPTSSVLFTKDA